MCLSFLFRSLCGFWLQIKHTELNTCLTKIQFVSFFLSFYNANACIWILQMKLTFVFLLLLFNSSVDKSVAIYDAVSKAHKMQPSCLAFLLQLTVAEEVSKQ